MRLISAGIFIGFILSGLTAKASPIGGQRPAGTKEALGLTPEKAAKDYSVQQIAATAPGNVLWPKDEATFTLQFVNKTDKPIKATGKVEVISYATISDPGDPFALKMSKVADIGSVPVQVEIAANGYADVTVKPPIPEKFGAYALVVDLEGRGRDFAAACVRTPAAAPGRVQFPTFAMDLRGPLELYPLFQRIGIKGTRMEIGYFRTTTGKDFDNQWANLTNLMKMVNDHDITLMITAHSSGDGSIMPLGRIRSFLNDQNEGPMNYPGDFTWLPQYDDDYQKWVKTVAGTFGWPKGPVNAIELWNEPWEGVSISGWGADMLRYREIFTRMAQGIEQARKESGVQVLIGGACSSMNTEDKLFPDGKDTFLKWLDFTSIHYQPMAAIPALIPEWVNRKSPFGPVRVWDTESWVANSEDRVAGVIASMRAQGQSRTAGVLHDATYEVQECDIRQADKTKRISVVQAWAPAAAIAATQKFIGERPFKELLFKNGLPWIFVFDGQTNPDDSTVVVVGDMSGFYERDRLLFRSVLGLEQRNRVDDAKKKLAALPANAPEAIRKEMQTALKIAQVLDGATMTLADGGGKFALLDFYGNPLPSKDGKIAVPLNGLGYFLRTDGTPGSFAKLTEALQISRIDGLEPLDVAVHDMTARIEKKPALKLTLTNILNRPAQGTLVLHLGNLKLEPATQMLEFGAHETKELSVQIVGGNPSVNNSYPLSLTFDAGADGKSVRAEDVHVNVITKRTITVDGQLGDWKGILPQPFTSADSGGPNLTEKAWYPFVKFDEKTGKGFAITYLAYDDNNFYFAAKIVDDSLYDGNVRFATRDDDQYFFPEKSYQVERDKDGKVTKREELIWPAGVRRFSYRKNFDVPSGDGTDNVQIGFNVIPLGQDGMLPNPPGTMPRFMAYKCTDYEYVFNQVASKWGGGTEIWRLLAPGVPRKHFYPRQPKAAIDGGPVTDGKLSMIREGNTRIVEASLPWSELPDVKKRLDAGELIKFTCRVNDNKGPSYELAGGRSVSKINIYALHDYWQTSWANEMEFSFEK